MSQQGIVNNQGNQAHIQNDTSKVFIWQKEDESADLTNLTGGTLNLKCGTLLGRITTGGKLGEVLPLKSGAVDGSKRPLGILMHDIDVLDTETANVTYVIHGDVVESKIIFDGADGFDTVIDSELLRDLIKSNTKGIRVVPSIELSNFDNQ